MRLQIGDPETFVVVQEHDPGGNLIERGAADFEIGDFVTAAVPRFIVPQQPGVHDLLSSEGGPPPKVADRVAAMGPSLHGPQGDRAVWRQRVAPRPVDLPRLLFDNDGSRPRLEATDQIVVERGQIRVTGSAQ